MAQESTFNISINFLFENFEISRTQSEELHKILHPKDLKDDSHSI